MATVTGEFAYIQEARTQLAEALINKFGVQRKDILDTDGNIATLGLYDSNNVLKRLHDWTALVTSTATLGAPLIFKNDGKGVAPGSQYTGAEEVTISYNTVGAASSEHTHSFITNGNFSLNLTTENQINFGGDSDSDIIYFGSTSQNGRPTPTKFIFGANGKANITALNFNGNWCGYTNDLETEYDHTKIDDTTSGSTRMSTIATIEGVNYIQYRNIPLDYNQPPSELNVGGTTKLYSDSEPYTFEGEDPYYAHLTYNVNNDSKWYLRVSPKNTDDSEKPLSKSIAVDWAYNAQQEMILQSLDEEDTSWNPLIWGGEDHHSTEDSIGILYKSYEALVWQTSSQTLRSPNILTNTLFFIQYAGDDLNPQIFGEAQSDYTNLVFKLGTNANDSFIFRYNNTKNDLDLLSICNTATTINTKTIINYPASDLDSSLFINLTGTNENYPYGIDIQNSDTNDNLIGKNIVLLVGGRNNATNNQASYLFHYGGNNSNDTYAGLGFWGNDFILNWTTTKKVGIGTTSPSYKLHVVGDILAEGWLRTTGNRGWYSETYGGGWYMVDSDWVRVYNNKGVYTGNEIQANCFRANNNNGSYWFGSTDARISYIDNDIIFNSGGSLRFGKTDWNWDTWAGLKYDSDNNYLYLGLAGNSVFTCNSGRSGGSLQFPGIANIYNAPAINFANVSSGACNGLFWTCGDNDFARIRAGATGSNSGYLEIATADDATEPIYFRQYWGTFTSVARTLTLLSAEGFSYFPSYINIGGDEGNNSSPNRVWGSNGSDTFLRSYLTSALSVNYATSAGNADYLDGYHANGSSSPWNSIPIVKSDGVMEIGRYIDFHHDNNGWYDYSTRLQTQGNYQNQVFLPTESGTLALTSGIWKTYQTYSSYYIENGIHAVLARTNSAFTIYLPWLGTNTDYDGYAVLIKRHGSNTPTIQARGSNGIIFQEGSVGQRDSSLGWNGCSCLYIFYPTAQVSGYYGIWVAHRFVHAQD